MFELLVTRSVGRLTLDRPKARNAIPADAWPRLAQQAEAAVAQGARVLLIGGRGSAFCAGADLADFAAFRSDPEAAGRFRVAMRDALERLTALPIPTVALIEGSCFGAGVALAMACDLRMAGPAARFAITPAKLGISYPQEDVQRLVSLVGAGQAMRLLLTAATIDAAEAVRIGLVEVIASDRLDVAVGPLVEALLANGRAGLAALKRAVRLAAGGVAADAEADRLFEERLRSDETAERLMRLRTAPADPA